MIPLKPKNATWTDEQWEAIYEDNNNIIVSAGAGSGKTAVLTERVIRKLKDGVHVNELLILTFTKAAAAEMAVPLQADLQQQILDCKKDLYTTIKTQVEQKRLLIRSFNPENLEIRFRNIQQPLLNRFDQARNDLCKNLTDKIRDIRSNIENCKTVLENASPQTILERGYSMVTDESGNVIRKANQVQEGQKLKIRPADGEITVGVISRNFHQNNAQIED